MPSPRQPASTQHEPRVPGGRPDEPDMRDDDQPNVDLPGKPFRTPAKSKTHPAPGAAAGGHKPQPGQDEPRKK
jgi:hypothetical protein